MISKTERHRQLTKKGGDEMGRPRKTPGEQITSVLDQPESPVMGCGEITEETINVWDDEVIAAEESMMANIIAMALDTAKQMESLWAMMPITKREELVDRITAQAADIARKCAEQIAAKGRRIVTGYLKKVDITADIGLMIRCPRTEQGCAAFGMASAGGTVHFILQDTESLLDPGVRPQVDPVQGALDLDEENEGYGDEPTIGGYPA